MVSDIKRSKGCIQNDNFFILNLICLRFSIEFIKTIATLSVPTDLL